MMPRTLSESIRLGATLRPQAYGYYLLNNHTCALGAALDAIGYGARIYSAWAGGLEKHWPQMDTTVVSCPVPGCPEHAVPANLKTIMTLGCAITHLNDQHLWKRERIADWVASVGDVRTLYLPEWVAVEDDDKDDKAEVKAKVEEGELVCV